MRKLIVSCSVLALLLVAANAAVAATPERWDGVSHYETRLGVFFHCGCGEKSLGRTGSKVNAYFQLGEDGKTWFYIGDDQNGYHECECGNDVWWNDSNQSGTLDGKQVKCVGIKGNGGGGGGGCDCGNCTCDDKKCGCDCGCDCGDEPPPPPFDDFGALKICASVKGNVITNYWWENWTVFLTPYKVETQFISASLGSTLTTYDQRFTKGPDGEVLWQSGNSSNGMRDESNGPVTQTSNHFTFAKLSKAELEEGSIDLVLVKGNGVDVTTTAKVSLNEDGTLNIVFDGIIGGKNCVGLYEANYGVVAFDGFLPLENKNSSNIHSYDCFSYGKKVNTLAAVNVWAKTDITGDKKSKELIYDKDWDALMKSPKTIWDADSIFVYFKGDVTLYLGKTLSKKMVDKEEVQGEDEEEIVKTPRALDYQIKVWDEQDNKLYDSDTPENSADLSKLAAGTYIVEFLVFDEDGTVYEESQDVEIVKDETAKVSFSFDEDVDGGEVELDAVYTKEWKPFELRKETKVVK